VSPQLQEINFVVDVLSISEEPKLDQELFKVLLAENKLHASEPDVDSGLWRLPFADMIFCELGIE